MCLDCDTDDELDECPFDADEHHPSDWPDDATRDDYPDDLPEPTGWHEGSGKPYDSNWRSNAYYRRCGATSPGKLSEGRLKIDTRPVSYIPIQITI
jgi:hypothetical protein